MPNQPRLAQRKRSAPLGKNLKCSITSLPACCLPTAPAHAPVGAHFTVESSLQRSHCSSQLSAVQVPQKARSAAAQAPIFASRPFNLRFSAPQKPASVAARNSNAKPRGSCTSSFAFNLPPNNNQRRAFSFSTIPRNTWSFSLLLPPCFRKHTIPVFFSSQTTPVWPDTKTANPIQILTTACDRANRSPFRSRFTALYTLHETCRIATLYTRRRGLFLALPATPRIRPRKATTLGGALSPRAVSRD